jgi:transposase-like protein
MDQTMTATPAPVHADRVPDREVPERAKRRTFTASYKLQILEETDKAKAGEIGAILRREGLYSSTLTNWREQRRKGALENFSGKRGPKPNPLAAENAKLRRQNEKLRRDLEAARLVIDVQKKVSRLLQTPENEGGS